MLVYVGISPLAKTQRAQRRSPRVGLARAHNRTRTARNHGPDSTFSYSFANKLTNITSGSATANHRYAYDSAGNLTNLLSNTATNRFFYNVQNKLIRIEGRCFTNEFLYDSQNRRIGVKLSGTWRYDVHDGNLCIGSVVNGLLDRFFVRGAGIAEGTGDIIAEIPDPRNPSPHPYYYISNHRGDTLVVLNDVYNIAARYEYDAYGNVIEKTGSYTPTYTFSSKEYLAAAGLYLYQYRAYDPIVGRWTQRDPIDYQDSINLYQFCGNNPVNNVDVAGLDATNLQERISQLNVYIDDNSNTIVYMENNPGKYPPGAKQTGSAVPGLEVTKEGKKESQDYQDAVRETERSPERRQRALSSILNTLNPFISAKEANRRHMQNELEVQKLLQQRLIEKRDALQREFDASTNRQASSQGVKP